MPNLPSIDDIREVVTEVLREELGSRQSQDRLMDAKEVASLLGVQQRTVWDYRKQGKLDAVELGHGCLRFKQSEVDRFIAQRTTSEPTPKKIASRLQRSSSVSTSEARGGGK